MRISLEWALHHYLPLYLPWSHWSLQPTLIDPPLIHEHPHNPEVLLRQEVNLSEVYGRSELSVAVKNYHYTCTIAIIRQQRAQWGSVIRQQLRGDQSSDWRWG